MMYLKAKYLEARELPEKPPYPRSCLVSLLVGIESVSLTANHEVLESLEGHAQFEELLFEVNPRQIDLAQYGAKGKAFRLKITGVVGPEDPQ